MSECGVCRNDRQVGLKALRVDEAEDWEEGISVRRLGCRSCGKRWLIDTYVTDERHHEDFLFGWIGDTE